MRAGRRARDDGRRLSNVVFMGMGEPLANYDPTWAAVERLHADVGLSARHLTVSTVGIVPGIRRLATEALPVNLAVSLHAADDELRDELVPINRRYPLSTLMDACAGYLQAKGRRLSFEWALIDGVNDRPSDARAPRRAIAQPAAARPREPDPAQPHAGLRGARLTRQTGARVPRRAARRWRERHRPPHPRHRDRRRLRPAPGHHERPTSCAHAERSPQASTVTPRSRARMPAR